MKCIFIDLDITIKNFPHDFHIMGVDRVSSVVSQRTHYAFLSNTVTCDHVHIAPGFEEGYVYWNDENDDNRNFAWDALPEGIYDSDTLMHYCCREDGFASNPIYLPTEDPFILIKKNHQCQEVGCMSIIMEQFGVIFPSPPPKKKKKKNINK